MTQSTVKLQEKQVKNESLFCRPPSYNEPAISAILSYAG